MVADNTVEQHADLVTTLALFETEIDVFAAVAGTRRRGWRRMREAGGSSRMCSSLALARKRMPA
mgnify:CR=1 FL=1